MPRLASINDLNRLRAQLEAERARVGSTVTLCGGTGCQASGSLTVLKALKEELDRQALAHRVRVRFSGCHGFCEHGPIMIIEPGEIFYCHVTPEDVTDIVSRTVARGEVVERLLYTEPVSGNRVRTQAEMPFYQGQHRVLLANSKLIEPQSVEDYIAIGGYAALGKVLEGLEPEEVIAQVKDAGLRGRGGAGFPTGVKWGFCRQSPGDEKYLICNADEGDPGAFMDRSLLEGCPHAVIEGMLIGAYAIGATHGIIYVRAEYPLAVRTTRTALQKAREFGLLGVDILGTGWAFDIEIREGAGAFVCGEETALIASLEGKRGMPRPRPPFPAQVGYRGKPTNINNVETFANVPPIILRGSEWYAGIGTETSKGTKIFALTGRVNNTGLVEVPMGATLRQIVFDVGGGMPPGRHFKAAQLGGPSGGCLPAKFLDLPIDYESVKQVGAIMGSGGLIVMDDKTCIVEIARFFLDFVQKESCGKCTPCRIGTRRMLEMLERIVKGEEDDPAVLDELMKLALTVKETALCGLGQTAPNPVISTLTHFRDEYLAHIEDKHCVACTCEALVKAPCRHTCPLHMDAYAYIALIAAGKFREAGILVREENPFPGVLGRVCNHPCESKCKRSEIDEAISVCALKRFAAENFPPEEVPLPQIVRRQERVAIVGAGPAGLSAARRLAQYGYQVVVFERLPVPGGMLMVGIPEYRLPRDILQQEIDLILRLGITLKTETPIGEDPTVGELLADGFNAVFVATGAHADLPLRLEGQDLPGVWPSVHFLRAANLHEPVQVGRQAVVIGGGNVATDCARVLLRLGAEKVTIVYRRTRQQMPADPWEIDWTAEEGIELMFLVSPVRVVGNGGVTGIECLRMQLGEMDATLRRRPVPLPGSEFLVPADTVVLATGQRVTVPFTDADGVALRDNGTVAVEKTTLQTAREGVFAGGDCVRGPATVVQACADGQLAALAIHRYISGEQELTTAFEYRQVALVPDECFAPDLPEDQRARQHAPVLPPDVRRKTFDEFEHTLTPEQAVAEARRCLRCDLEES